MIRHLPLPLILVGFLFLVACASTVKRSETGAAGTPQCREFCRSVDQCLGSEFSDELKQQLCELARCESGCRAKVRSAAGYEGAYQFAGPTWKSICYPIFDRRNLPHCQNQEAKNDLCCASICTAEMIAGGGIKHWPTCGR